MELVLGELNSRYLKQILAQAPSSCDFVQAAVAYAHGSHEFFDHCKNNEIRLQFYGLLDQTIAVSLPVLDLFLKDKSGRMECRLINGHFHSKVIWWHGYGAYIGSANLTHAAWYKNVECGIFFTEEELYIYSLGQQLEEMFSYLHRVSLPLTEETYSKLSQLLKQRQADVTVAEREIQDKFSKLFENHLPHAGPTVILAKGQGLSRAQIVFVKEWYETLELIRKLTKKFTEADWRPAWVSPDAMATVHFDQFLHAYYYEFTLRGSDDDGKSVEIVERAYERHRSNLEAAFQEAGRWWTNLKIAPHGEDEFIAKTVPIAHELLKADAIRTMDIDTFTKAMEHVNAFRTHARQVWNKTLGLPPGHNEDHDKRTRRFAAWLWDQRTETGLSIREVLEFVLYGKEPQDLETRLWTATHDPNWRLPHLGKSILGEAVGWARPSEYPPRNNRTNKALRALGYDVELFATE
jgi:hypothetical protein